MKPAPPGEYWPFHFRRFFGSARVRELSPQQKLLFIAALSLQYEQGEVAGSDLALQVAFAGCFVEWETDWAAVKPFFPGGRNPLMAELREEIIAKSETARESGRRGGQASVQARLKRPFKGRSSKPSRVAQATRGEERREEKNSPPGSAEGADAPRSASPRPPGVFQDWLDEHPALDTSRFREAWLAYEDQRAQGPKRTRMTPRARDLALKKLEGLGPEEAAGVVERSVMNGWQGIFPERKNGHALNGHAKHAEPPPTKTKAQREREEAYWRSEREKGIEQLRDILPEHLRPNHKENP